MATDQGEPGRRPVDPLVAGVGEGVAAGYRAVESVVEGMAESLRRRPGASSARGASARQRTGRTAGARRRSTGKGPGRASGRARASSTTGDELADLIAALLDRFGEAAQDIAGYIGERDWFDGPAECPRLGLDGVPGALAEDEFRFTNTGSSALRELGFEATDLLGAAARIDAGQVGFEPQDKERSARLRPGGSTMVTLTVAIPDEVPAGTYRGVIATRSAAPVARGAAEGGPEGAWALLELEVGATDPRRVITPAERPKAS